MQAHEQGLGKNGVAYPAGRNDEDFIHKRGVSFELNKKFKI